MIIFLLVVVNCYCYGSHVYVDPPIESNFPIPLSMVKTYPGETSQWNFDWIDIVFGLLKNTSFQISHRYIRWTDIQTNKDDWDLSKGDWSFMLYEKYMLDMSVSISIIATNLIPDLPIGLTFVSFDEVELMENFINFTINLLKRHDGKVKYLWIGNEVDIYFHNHKNEVNEFKILYQAVYNAVKNEFPDIMIGTIITYHDMKKNNMLDIVNEICIIGDIIGWTFYPQMIDGLLNEKEKLEKIYDYFLEMEQISTNLGKKFAITETTLSTIGYQGSELYQSKYIKELFKVVLNFQDQMEFLGLFALYDLSEKTNEIVLQMLIGPQFNSSIRNDFFYWHGSLGFIQNNGTAKLGWYTLLDEIKHDKKEKKYFWIVFSIAIPSILFIVIIVVIILLIVSSCVCIKKKKYNERLLDEIK